MDTTTRKNEPVCTESFTISNKLGLHARAAASFVKIANRYQCDIMVQKDGTNVNGKSIMGVLMLAACKGTIIEVKAAGFDSQDALRAIGTLINEKFGEE